MQLEGFLAARRELGFYLWGALVRMDGAIVWSAADCIGRGPSCSTAAAQYAGVLVILKKLGELKRQNTTASITLFADSLLIDELQAKAGQVRGPSAMVDEAIDLIHRTLWPLTLRYCSRSGLRAAHELIETLCRRHGVTVQERERRAR